MRKEKSSVIKPGEAGPRPAYESLDRNLFRTGQGRSVKLGRCSPRVRKHSMWIRLEGWQSSQLERLAQMDPERAEAVLNTLWAVCPGLLEDMAISAVDQEALPVDECARLIGVEPQEVERRLIDFRKHTLNLERAVVSGGCTNGAKLAGGQVAVWEIIREFRKLGSVARLRECFPSLSEGELASAFLYAEGHKGEIEEKIGAYENMLARRRSEYPFVK